MAVHIDNIAVSSLFEAFKNYTSPQATITISGTIPPGGASFSASIPYDRAGSVAELKYLKSGATYARYTDNLQRLVDYSGSTDAYLSVRYTSTTVNIIIDVSNFGAGYTAPTETYTFYLFIFDAPITN